MPVTDKMKSALRRTMGGQNTGDAPFNAASQGGYRNMARQLAGGAKMSPRGMARAQQGVATQTRGAPLTANDMTQAAAGQALQRVGGGPAATDAMAQRGMGGGLANVDTSMARGFAGGFNVPQMGGVGQAPVGGLQPGMAPTGAQAGRDPAGAQGFGVPADPTSAMVGASQLPANAAAADAAARAAARAQADAAERESYAGAGSSVGTSQSTEDLVEGAIRDLLMGGLRDTTAEENLAREMIEAQQQQALVDQRARAGRAGLVQTGAQAGIESDIRQQAAQAALREIMGIQSEARGEQRADIGLAGQLYGMDKGIAAEEARTSAMLQALQQMYGQGEEADRSAGLSSEQKATLNSLESSDLSMSDEDSQPGTRGVPYKVTQDDMDKLAAQGITLTKTTEKAENTFGIVYDRGHTIYVDQNGNYYISWED